MYPYARGYLISRFKTHALYIVCELVRIFFQNFVYTHTVILIYLCCESCRNSIFLEVDHCLSHVFLSLHLFCDLPRLSLTDPLDFRKALRLFLDNTECIFFKPPYDPSRKGSPHAFNRPGAEISLDGYEILRFFHHMGRDFKLCSIYIVIHILSCELQHFSLIYKIEISNAGHFPVIVFQMKDCISIFLIPEHNVSHISCDCLHCLSLLILITSEQGCAA